MIDKIRNINEQTRINNQVKTYMYGTILSGSYTNWKTDAHPTIFCFGVYNKNGVLFVHGIQMHQLGTNLQWFLNLICNCKKTGFVTNPVQFYNYLKMNGPYIIKKCYRTYKVDCCNFKIVNPGLTNIQNFYKPDDPRDVFLNQLTPYISQPKQIIDTTALRENITNVLNTIKVW